MPDAEPLDYDALSDDDIMARCRAARAMVDTAQGERASTMALEAFMAMFHPERHKDRAYMGELRNARRGRE